MASLPALHSSGLGSRSKWSVVAGYTCFGVDRRNRPGPLGPCSGLVVGKKTMLQLRWKVRSQNV